MRRRLIAPIRQVVQLGALAITGEWLFIGALRCPYGIPFMSCTHCPMRVCPGTWLQPWVIGIIALSSVVAGRVFCGWGCPMGTVQDLLARIPKLRAFRQPGFGRLDLDPAYVAYVRFASVYRKFTNIDKFANELKKIKKERRWRKKQR